MNPFFLGLTLGGDPHTLGIFNAGRIAKMAGLNYYVIPADATNDEKLELIMTYEPKYLGISYRLTAKQGINELEKFMQFIYNKGLMNYIRQMKLCFAALPATLDMAHQIGLDKKYNLILMGQDKDIVKKTLETLNYFNIYSEPLRSNIVDAIKKESEPPRIKILDELAKDIVKDDSYFDEAPLPIPNKKSIYSLATRICTSDYPIIRTHFGVPSDTILPTIVGIEKLAQEKVVDEISLGSSDLSQRYFGHREEFEKHKNDGGVPYKDAHDLELLLKATRRGNYPSLKPYCHVVNIKQFIDTCLEIGLLYGAHQAIPLYWFDELDGRGPMSVSKAIDKHMEAVKYLAKKEIPVEMNDPNQWSSRFVHDSLFVADYALITSVMRKSGVKDMVFQHQFNKPAVTGDYADLAKMSAAIDIVKMVRGDESGRSFIETRAGIEHFSTDMSYARYQLVRTTLLQMILSPDIVHLVSYCEADHVATAEDIIESSKLIRYTMKYFRKYEYDIRKEAIHPFVKERKQYLLEQATYLTQKIASLHPQYQRCSTKDVYRYVADANVLAQALKKRYVTAPGIINPQYAAPDMFTKPGTFGNIDCYKSWNSKIPQTEQERIAKCEFAKV